MADDDLQPDGWTAEPVDHDPFDVPDTSGHEANQFAAGNAPGAEGRQIYVRPHAPPGENPAPPTPSSVKIAGHIAASPIAGQVFTPKYLAAHPQGSISEYDPSYSERIQQGVSETAQKAGFPTEGAERMGSTVRAGAEMAPGVGNILSGNEAYRSYQAGDPWGAILQGAMALPIPGASAEEGVARRISPLGFYSHGADMAANLPQKVGTTQQMVSALQKAGVKPVEMQKAGVQKLADTAPTLFPEKVDRGALEEMFHKSSPELQETVLQDSDNIEFSPQARQLRSRINEAEEAEDWDEVEALEQELAGVNSGVRMSEPPKFESYVLPGPKENYREVLLHTPEAPRTFAAHRGDTQISPDFPDAAAARDWVRTQRTAPERLGLSVRETTPEDQAKPFTASHWDTPNVVAHLRFSDRRGAPSDDDAIAKAKQFASRLGEDWDKVPIPQQRRYMEAARESAEAPKHLHMEELQSDWGQKGRSEGFTRPLTPEEQELEKLYGIPGEDTEPNWQRATELERAGVGRSLKEAKAGQHPPGPYVTNTNDWTDLGLKRALVEAARGDYTHLSWATGKEQADRYSLRKQISDLSYNPETGSLQARSVGGGRGIDEKVPPEKLKDYVGQETAQKLLAAPRGPHFSARDESEIEYPRSRTAAWQREGWHTLSGQDLEVGGEGMTGYYDKVVPNQLQKLIKKLDPGVKIGATRIEGKSREGKFSHQVHSIPITPLMRERILKGMPQYKRGGRVGFAGGGAPDPTGYSVTYGDPQLEPVEHDPFPPEPAVLPSDIARAKGAPEPRSPMHARIEAAGRPAITGHVAASQVPGQVLTPRYLQEKPQGSLSEYDPSYSERIQQGVSEGAQKLGVPPQGAERIGETVRTGAEMTPGVSNVLSANDAYRAADKGDMLGAATGVLGALPMLGAAPEQNLATRVMRHNLPAFSEGRIATTVPSSVALRDTAHANNEATIGLHTIRDDPDMYSRSAAAIREIPHLNIPANATDDEVHEAFINHAKSNLLALHDAVPEEIRQGSQQWYDGANALAHQRAMRYGRPLENVAGVYAALSPQMDWYKNVSLGDRVMDTLHHQQYTVFSPDMEKWANTYATRPGANAATAGYFDQIRGKTLGEINDPYLQAHWLRAYDEAHNPREYALINPDGSFGSPVATKSGENAKAGWGGFDQIENAINAFNARDGSDISRAMGDRHKVRSFFNNIVAPNSDRGDVTVDTHAIAAALLRPLSGAHQEVSVGLGSGGPKSARSGAKGLYGPYAEAYRRAAAERGILPRQMQSITWEALRGLYTPAEKGSASFRQGVDSVWDRFRRGQIDQPTAQQMLMTHPETGASKIRPPSWHTGSAEEED